jgi:hypothetical protein
MLTPECDCDEPHIQHSSGFEKRQFASLNGGVRLYCTTFKNKEKAALNNSERLVYDVISVGWNSQRHFPTFHLGAQWLCDMIGNNCR